MAPGAASWFKLIGIVLSAQHKHSKPGGTSTKHLVRCMCSGLAGGFVAHVALLACVGGLMFIVSVCIWELPRRLVFTSCVRWDGTCCARGGCRAGLRLLHWWHAVWCNVCVVSSLAACLAPWLGGCFLAARAVLLVYVVRLAFLVRVCL